MAIAGSSSPSWKAILTMALFSMVMSCSGKSSDSSDQKVYIVYMGDRPKGGLATEGHHMSMLHATLGRKRAQESWLYSYKRSFNGFVARLTEEEREKIASMEGVVSVFPSTKKQLHTTRSWDFMGFPVNVQRSRTESDVIVAILDTGIWPESDSFRDEGFGPPPTKWKGRCQSSTNFSCNNKIIGARYYRNEGSITRPDVPSPRDTLGHGTHAASIAAGGLVSGVNLYGFGAGTARGGVPSARIAVYKVCWTDGCFDSDILAAFDDAIADGVDIISVSFGTRQILQLDYFDDSIAIGAFHAMRNGILTSNSAGNDGPKFSSVKNYSPWSLTVAASTIDRKFLCKVQLGNNITHEGLAVNTFTLKRDSYPLVYGENVPNTAGGFNRSQSMYCERNSLDSKLVNGTIVVCKRLSDGGSAAAAGAIGAIMFSNEFGDEHMDFAQSFPLPASHLEREDGYDVYGYISRTSKPTATIFKSTEANDTTAPFVASLSSRGPNPITKEILKPDLTAPGADILAAWSKATTLTGLAEDTRIVPYNIISGTSVSCPHATAAAAYVKSFHPTWSPTAIKSALMTTATYMHTNQWGDESSVGGREFAYGSGHINPIKARSPGLVYDMGEADYVKFLCGQGYSDKKLQAVTGDKSTCTASNNATVYDLNYPSFAVVGDPHIFDVVFYRTVTNMGSPSSTYKAVVTQSPGIRIDVQPTTLSFTSIGEKKTFAVTVSANTYQDEMYSGSLLWDDGVHQVRSPVIAFHRPYHYNRY